MNGIALEQMAKKSMTYGSSAKLPPPTAAPQTKKISSATLNAMYSAQPYRSNRDCNFNPISVRWMGLQPRYGTLQQIITTQR